MNWAWTYDTTPSISVGFLPNFDYGLEIGNSERASFVFPTCIKSLFKLILATSLHSLQHNRDFSFYLPITYTYGHCQKVRSIVYHCLWKQNFFLEQVVECHNWIFIWINHYDNSTLRWNLIRHSQLRRLWMIFDN